MNRLCVGAWDALHRMDTQPINKEIIARINAKEQTDVLKDFIRQVVSEQLANIPQGGSVQPPLQQENCVEEIENVFDFLDSF